MSYSPSGGAVSKQLPFGMSNLPLDAKLMYDDQVNFTKRAFISTAEILTYFPAGSPFRNGNFEILLNTGGTLSNGVITGGIESIWWFSRGNLIQKYYTTLQVDNLISGITPVTPSLQQVMTQGNTSNIPLLVTGNSVLTGEINLIDGSILSSNFSFVNVRSTDVLMEAFSSANKGSILQFTREGSWSILGSTSATEVRAIQSIDADMFSVTDTLNNKGLEYAGNYEANFTGKSLVTRQYVDSLTTVSNGLTKTDHNIQLGGAITIPLVIGQTLTPNKSSIGISNTDVNIDVFGTLNQVSSLFINKSRISITGRTESLDQSSITVPSVSGQNMIVLDGISQRGLVNGGDYEANFIARSYITKQYLDSRITAIGIDNYQLLSEKGVGNGYASLGEDGKIPTNQLPSITISDTFVVASQSAMLSIAGAEKGDVAVRTDINKSFILTDIPASTLGNWQELLTPTDAVLSVNGQVGNVNLTTTNIVEGTNLYYTNDRVNTIVDPKIAAGQTIGANTTGNAATVTNGVVITGSYADPSWITSLAYSKITGVPAFALDVNVIHTTGNETKSGRLTLATPAAAAGSVSIAPLIVTGGKAGGNTTTTGTVTSSTAPNINVTGGAGGDITGITSGTALSGSGGKVNITGGDGGNTLGTPTSSFPGAGGDVVFQAGGSYGGVAGSSQQKAGNNYNVGGFGGDTYIVPGWGNNSSASNPAYDGTMWMGYSPGGTTRGNVVINATVDDRVNKLQVTGDSKFNGKAYVTTAPTDPTGVMRLSDMSNYLDKTSLQTFTGSKVLDDTDNSGDIVSLGAGSATSAGSGITVSTSSSAYTSISTNGIRVNVTETTPGNIESTVLMSNSIFYGAVGAGRSLEVKVPIPLSGVNILQWPIEGGTKTIATREYTTGVLGSYLPLSAGSLAPLTDQLLINKASGGLALSMKNISGAVGNLYIDFRNNANTRLGYIGFGSASNNNLSIFNDLGNVSYSGTSHDFNSAINGTSALFTGSVVTNGGAFTVNRAAGVIRAMFAQTSNVNRWHWGANTVAESGSQAGSDWTLERYSDAGANLGQAINVQRSTGNTTFGGNITAAAGTFSSTVAATTNISVTDAAATTRGLFMRTGVNNRWLVYTDTTAESGSNAGSNFGIASYTDAGAFLGNPLSINRATSLITVASNISAATAPTIGAHLTNKTYTDGLLAAGLGVNTISAAATLTLTVRGYYTFNGTTTTWTMPALAGSAGTLYRIINMGSGNLTLSAGTNEIYDSGVSSTTFVVGTGTSLSLYNNSLKWVILG